MSKMDIELGKLIMQAMYEYDSPNDCGNPRRWEFDDGGQVDCRKRSWKMRLRSWL